MIGRFTDWLSAPRFHAIAMVVWVLLAVPTVLWWRDSILWVSFMSLYAIVTTHATGYEAGLAKEEARNN